MNSTSVPRASERVRRLHSQMTPQEKLAQLVGYWLDQGGEVVAPMQGEMATSNSYAQATQDGLGHLTRVYGTRPVDPVERAGWLWAEQRRLRQHTRLGIPALVHEECLTGLAAWKAATFPAPPSWGASFDPALVEDMAAAIGASMRQLGIHQGLAPVLDVVRDARWGRVEECISEDPYLVGEVGAAYVRGLQSAGVHATLKHFLAYSDSQAGRNHAPVHAGRREIQDVFLVPFEIAVRDAGARSVMNSYNAIDGVPVAATPEYLTDLLRGELGFDGVVVADYFAVAFLHTTQQVAASKADAAALALNAGIDVELPSADAYPELLAPEGAAARARSAAALDDAVLRVLQQKEDLGLLDEEFDTPPQKVELDSPAHRDIARQLAVESAVLLSNSGVLPLDGEAVRKVAVIGPNAQCHAAMMGCYSFANHVLAHHPDTALGIDVPDMHTALAQRFTRWDITYEQGCDVEDTDTSGLPAAVAAAAAAELAVVVVGDRAGLFGRGTVGEGNDVETLNLPGVQRQLVEEVVATGTPTVMVLLTGRPYALDWALEGPHAPAAIVQSFFPGEEGAPALARLLAGDDSPSGRLPFSLPRSAGAQPYTYLHPFLGGPSEVTSADSTPVRPFGFGLSYTEFSYGDLEVTPPSDAAQATTAHVRVTNTGARAATEVVQLYARTPYRSTTRPLAQLVAFTRVYLNAGQSADVEFTVPAARLAASDTRYRRVVEPGPVELWVGDCVKRRAQAAFNLTGPEHVLTASDPRLSTARVRG